MKSSRVPSFLAAAAGTTSLVVALAGCGSGATDTASSSTPSVADAVSSSTTDAPAAAGNCPTAAPHSGATPQWTLSGETGSIAVIAPTEDTAPGVTVDGPFSVTETRVETLQAGDGAVVADAATVSVCYLGVNGRDGSVFDSSYQRGTPAEFPLDRVVPGFQKAIAGQQVGSSVAVAMEPADGYPDGEPRAGIQPGDTLVFAIQILDASS